jgi:intracellular multiplication protein IcmL
MQAKWSDRMLGRRQQIARLQSDFYRDQFRRMVRWLMGSLIIIFILVMMIIYFLIVEPSSKYYANTPEGQIVPMPRPSPYLAVK